MILSHESWPQEPFLEVAKKLGFTKTIFVSSEPLHRYYDLVRKLTYLDETEQIRITKESSIELLNRMRQWLSAR